MDNLTALIGVIVALFCYASAVYFLGDSLYGRSLQTGAIAERLPQRANLIHG